MKDDCIKLFADTEKIKTEIDDTYNGEYEDMLVKKIYETYPKIHYPMITIQEINNEDVNQYWDGDAENVSYLAYQIGINATQDEKLSATENVERIAYIIDGFMKQDTYKCMRRIGELAISPLISDNNVITGYLRYECNLDLKTNTIYRRY